MDITNIASRRGVSTVISPEAFAGMTHKKLLKKKLSGGRGEAHGKYKLVTYCPTCFDSQGSAGAAQKLPSIGISGITRTAFCKIGHRWRVV